MDDIQLGPMRFKKGHGAILERGPLYDFVSDPDGIVPALFGSPDDDLVSIEYVLEPLEVQAAAQRLHPGARLGGVLSAWNFDPPEDHPEEPEFQYLDAVIYDFRGINDDLDTLEGVRGEHFNRLLTWQPRIDPAKTALFAHVTPGPLLEVLWRDRDAAARLAATFDANGYDAVILSGHKHDHAEITILTDFAAEMADAVGRPLILATPSRLVTVPQPFAMNFTLGRLY
ncbi:MAG: hypothetical protein ACXWNK_09180 [Vulcanimicrobiaceae bacterium]